MSLIDSFIGGAIGAVIGFILTIGIVKYKVKLQLRIDHSREIKNLVLKKWQIEIKDRYRPNIIKPLVLKNNVPDKYEFSEKAFKQYENYWLCLREKHYPDLIEKWESLYMQMVFHTDDSYDFMKSLSEQVQQKGEINVKTVCKGMFVTHRLIDDLYNELLKRHGISAYPNLDRSRITQLDVGEKQVYGLNLSKDYFKLNFKSDIYAVANKDIISNLKNSTIPKLLENKKNIEKIEELIEEGKRLDLELVYFYKELQKIRDTVNIFPKKCEACKL